MCLGFVVFVFEKTVYFLNTVLNLRECVVCYLLLVSGSLLRSAMVVVPILEKAAFGVYGKLLLF